MTFDWSMVLSKSDLRGPPKTTLFFSFRICLCIYKTLFLCQLTHHAIIKMFKLSFCGSDKKMPTNNFCNPLFGLGLKVYADMSWLLVFKDGLKRVLALQKSAKKLPGKLIMKFVWTPQNPFFYIKDKKKKNLYIQNVGHIWAYIHANSQGLLKKVLTDLIRPNMSKKCG